MVETLVGGAVLTVLGVALTVLAASPWLRRLWAVRRALVLTTGANEALRTAVYASMDELRASAPAGDALLATIGEAMGPDRDDALIIKFLAQLHKRLSDRDMDLNWTPPVIGHRALSRRQIMASQMFGRSNELATLREWISCGVNTVISGPPGIGKTTLLDTLYADHSNAIYVRLEQGGEAMRDLRLALHRYCSGEFPVNDEQGIDLIARSLPDGVVLLADNADEPATAAAIMRIVGHLSSLTLIVTSRGQKFSGFQQMKLAPLPDGEANLLLQSLGLTDERKAEVVVRAEGNPLLLVQAGWAAIEGVLTTDENRLERVINSLEADERATLVLIGDLPSATLPTALLSDVGALSPQGFDLLRRNAVIKTTPNGYTAHETMRAACRDVVAELQSKELRALRVDVAKYYLEWLRTSPSLEEIDVARPNLLHLIATLSDNTMRVDLALALIGDNFDDARGYFPARGLGGLVLADYRAVLLEAAKDVGGLRAAQVEKNLGLFCYWSNDPDARKLLLSARARYRALGDDDGRAAATWLLGYIADDLCQYREAEELYRAPLSWLKDDSTRAISHHLIGCSLYHRRQVEEARREFLHARRLATDDALHARIERRLAYIELAIGDPTEAIRKLEQARDHSQELNRPRDVARISRHLAVGWIRVGELAKAKRELASAEEIFRSIGDQRGLGGTLRNRATVCRLEGKLDQARELALASRKIAQGPEDSPTRPMTSPVGAAWTDEELARIAQAFGETESATSYLRSACNMFEAIGHTRAEVLAHELASTVGRDAPIPAPKAILFDLIDTLAETKHEAYESAKRQMSAVLGVDHDRFKAAWARSRSRASTDPDWQPADRIQWVARELEVELNDDALVQLARLEGNLWTSSVLLRPDTLRILANLRSQDVRTMIISNGSTAMSGLVGILGLTPYVEATLLSCEARVLKPHLGIYQQALATLGLSADQCIYVGDGNDRELEGAMAAGIFAVRMLVSEMPAYDSSKSLNWNATVTSLQDLAQRIGAVS